MLRTLCGGGLLILLLLLAPAAYAQDGTKLIYDGIERTYTVVMPSSYDGTQAVPLVVALHPFASSGKAMEALTGFDAAAEDQGFIVVYPDSADLNWNDGRLATGWPLELPQTDDEGFMRALLDHLQDSYTIDPARVYLTGYGAGGTLAYRLACDMPDRFSKVAVMGALMWDYIADNCPADAAPVSILALVGADNVDVPLRGRTASDESTDVVLTMSSAEDTAAFWAERNSCDLDSVLTGYPTFSQYTACPDGTTVGVYALEGVGSNWPRVGDYVLNQSGIDATDIITQFFTGDQVSVQRTASSDVWGGVPRSYLLYVPPEYDPAEPMPLVIVLHGRTGNGAGMAYLLDANDLARERGVMMLYPDGLPVAPGEAGREWNYTHGSPGYRETGADDVKFFISLVDDLAQDLAIDRQRVYVTGFSNGGFMTMRTACEAGDQFAAFASVSATLFPDFIGLCAGKPPVPMLLMNGTKDNNVSWEGQTYGDQIMYYSAPDTGLFWVSHDECAPDATDLTVLPTSGPNPTTQVYIYTFGGCKGDSEVYFYAIEGGGHNLPGTADRLEESIAGSTNMDIVAAEEILNFFERHALPAED